jgi:hypothetical protein
MEEANDFLVHNEKAATMVSTGVMLCILSPILMIVLGGLAEAGAIGISEDTAGIGGLIILLIMVAIAVAMFLMMGIRGNAYEYLDKCDIDTEYGVSGMVKERKAAYAGTHGRFLIIGIMLCVISAIPMLCLTLLGELRSMTALAAAGVGLLLAMIAAGVKLIVLTCMRNDGFDKLLEEGDYTRLNKRAGKYDGIYWAIALAIYLGWSFITNRWEFTWIVWPIAGVLYAAYHEIMKAIVRSGKQR